MSFSGDSRYFLVFFYTLTKIHKPVLTGRPIILGCDGPTERISSFLDDILQPIAKVKKSYLKDTTQFINFIEKRKVPNNTVLVSMDVSGAPAREACVGQSPVLMEYGQPLFVWLSRD